MGKFKKVHTNDWAAIPGPDERCNGAWPCEASTAAASLEAEVADLRVKLADAEADMAQWRGFAGSVAVAIHAGDKGKIIANHIQIEDLPDLQTALITALKNTKNVLDTRNMS